jgi:hypothetical protein
MIATAAARASRQGWSGGKDFVSSIVTVRTLKIPGPSRRTREEIYSANENAVTMEYRVPTSPRQGVPNQELSEEATIGSDALGCGMDATEDCLNTDGSAKLARLQK